MAEGLTRKKRVRGGHRSSTTRVITQAMKKQNKEFPTAATMTSSANAPYCSYCRQSHLSSSCKTVTDPEERKKVLMKDGRCFICLRRYHRSRDCRSSLKCSNCGGRHHLSICDGNQSRSTRSASAEVSTNRPRLSNSQGAPPTNVTPTSSMHCVSAKMPVLLQTARAHVYNVKTTQPTKEVRILFDGGSQRSYVTEGVQQSLSLQPDGVETMLIKTFGSDKENKQVCSVVNLGLLLKDGGHMEMSLLTVPLICEPLSTQPITRAKEVYQDISDLDLADFSYGDDDLEVDILIGSDHYWKLVTGEVIRGPCGPAAIRTRLGWVLSGPVELTSSESSAVNLASTHTLRTDAHAAISDNQDLNEGLKRFWDLETLGIKEDESSVYEEFERNVTSRKGRYEVRLPWKEPHPVLPDNHELCSKRLVGLLKRLRQNPHVLTEYDTVIKDQLSKGIVEDVEQPDMHPG